MQKRQIKSLKCLFKWSKSLYLAPISSECLRIKTLSLSYSFDEKKTLATWWWNPKQTTLLITVTYLRAYLKRFKTLSTLLEISHSGKCHCDCSSFYKQSIQNRNPSINVYDSVSIFVMRTETSDCVCKLLAILQWPVFVFIFHSLWIPFRNEISTICFELKFSCDFLRGLFKVFISMLNSKCIRYLKFIFKSYGFVSSFRFITQSKKLEWLQSNK